MKAQFIDCDFIKAQKAELENECVRTTVCETVEVDKQLILKSVNSSSKCASSTIIESFDNQVSWITWLFEQSETIYKDKITYFLQNNDPKIMVFGDGSSKLESKLFKQYLNNDDWHIEQSSAIGTLASLKQAVLASSKYSPKFKFVDAQAYTTDSSLPEFLKHSNATTLIDAIDKLISLNAEYHVDLLHNFSLSKNAICIKYAMAYKQFENDFKSVDKSDDNSYT